MRENREDLSGLELGLSTAKEELPTGNLNEADAGRCVKSCRPKGYHGITYGPSSAMDGTDEESRMQLMHSCV